MRAASFEDADFAEYPFAELLHTARLIEVLHMGRSRRCKMTKVRRFGADFVDNVKVKRKSCRKAMNPKRTQFHLPSSLLTTGKET